MTESKPKWNADSIRKFRKSLGMTQAEFANELGSRQQTISEWELGMYVPKNAYCKLLDLMERDAVKDKEPNQ